MDIHYTQLFLALVEGIGLVASPCILPILPIMLAASLDGGKRRPLGIITGFILAFTVFALLSRQLLEALHADPEIVRNVALALLALFGFVMLSKKLSDKLLGATQGLANLGQNLSSRWDRKNGYFSGVAIGALIGLIWTPCAGPIMAAAVVQIVQAKTSAEATLTVIMFALGAGIPMLAIALAGRQVATRLGFFKKHSYAVRRVLGVIIIAAAVLIYEGADVQLLASAGKSSNETVFSGELRDGLEAPYPAPEFVGISEWINSPPLKMADLRGKVVLVDFWTYSCINCVRTLPHLTGWDAKYRDKGLLIIGVHSPEFEFEKKADNVRMATEKFGIKYPVALDNHLATWSAFYNKYWPAHYLIDQKGQIVYTHFGEGDYDVTEGNIRALLGIGGEVKPPADNLLTYTKNQTLETYLGYGRMQNFAAADVAPRDKPSFYTYPSDLKPNCWALEGEWIVGRQSVVSQKPDAGLRLNFTARKVFLVLGTKPGKSIHVHVTLNGKPASSADVKDGNLTVDQERLYELIDQGEGKNGLLELKADEPGLMAYAFTFGG